MPGYILFNYNAASDALILPELAKGTTWPILAGTAAAAWFGLY